MTRQDRTRKGQPVQKKKDKIRQKKEKTWQKKKRHEDKIVVLLGEVGVIMMFNISTLGHRRQSIISSLLREVYCSFVEGTVMRYEVVEFSQPDLKVEG